MGRKPQISARKIQSRQVSARSWDDPSAYNNKLVKVRGYVEASLEHSVLLDGGVQTMESGLHLLMARA